jgi:hypothetical protein
MDDAELLQNLPHRRVMRVGDTVRRPTHPWTPTIHELLRHLETVGFPYSPRVLGVDGERHPEPAAGVRDVGRGHQRASRHLSPHDGEPAR